MLLIILSHIKNCLWVCSRQRVTFITHKNKNMHVACHGFNTKIASTEGESSHYYWSSTQEVQFVNIFCSNFRHKLEESQINLVIHPLHSHMIQILYTITPNSPWWQNLAQSTAVMLSNSLLYLLTINCNFMFMYLCYIQKKIPSGQCTSFMWTSDFSTALWLLLCCTLSNIYTIRTV